ncbi:MAG: ABC transporter ATP-binding protein [Pseudomonadota bacterium]
MADPVLSIEGVSKSFGALAACSDVSLTLKPGEIHALIGPNGAGKSTLMKLIAGELKPDTGRVKLADESIDALGPVKRARKGMARTFQISSLVPEFTVLQNVQLAQLQHHSGPLSFLHRIASNTPLREAALDALERTDLQDRADVLVSEVSHGERRQLEVALALSRKPKVLLMDEPMAGMGPDGTARLTKLIDSLRKQVPVLLVEHDMDAVFALADRLTVLVYGRVLTTGSVEDVRNNKHVQQAYLGGDA